jgi:hypothetical protein
VLTGIHLSLSEHHARTPVFQTLGSPADNQIAPTPVGASTPSGSAAPSADLVRWHGPVEHLFFHTLVVRPELAFRDDPLGHGFRDYMVTAREFRSILDEMWRHGWTLVDIHRAVAGTVRVPRGRKPFVLAEDDANYYDYSRTRGQAWRLVLDPTGAVKVEIRDDRGTRVTGDDLVPIVEDFVDRHPEFSAEGAKGVLALTAYQGLFGERLQKGDLAAAARARALAEQLKAHGWTLASHTYGHIHLERDSVRVVRRDTERWLALAGPIVGPTDVVVYPYGGRPSPAGERVLAAAGFTIQCDIDPRARLTRQHGVAVMSRRHIDGLAFRNPRSVAMFFSVQRVRDPRRPPD